MTLAALAALALLSRAPARADESAVKRAVAPLSLPSAPPSLAPAGAPQAPDDALVLPPGEALRIGRLLWRNEAGGKVSALTDWNQGEAFASLGIGHFIWYPAGPRGPFVEGFPPLLDYLASRGVALPAWLASRPPCPWPDRASFYRDFQSPRMRALRGLLAGTVGLQADFAAVRLQEALPRLLAAAEPARRAALRAQFWRVAGTPGGFYPLIDYVDFKGDGTSASERYQGRGWGLLQVLEGMSGAAPGQAALDEFSASAARVLKRRVRLSPPGRGEGRWLPNWLSRVDTYRRPLDS